MAADGTRVTNLADIPVGSMLSFVGPVYDADDRSEVGYGEQNDIVSSDGRTWHGEGTYIDLYGCTGHIAYSGFFDVTESKGSYVIEGGSGVFQGATGSISELYHDKTGYSAREITIT